MTNKKSPLPMKWEPNEIDLALFLAGLEGMSYFARLCHQFYTDSKLSKDLPSAWTPWSSKGANANHLEWLIPQITDETTRQLCESLAVQVGILDDVNDQWCQELAGFLRLPIPRYESDFRKLRIKLDNHRKNNGADWAVRAELHPLVAESQKVVTETQRIWLQLQERIRQRYADVLISREDLGDQRAKDIIDRAYEVEPKSAIRLLARALSYGRTGIQASKAFEELGNRYRQLGDVARAIENYTNSLEAWREPGWMALFHRGELYYQQHRWDEARSDFERVLSLKWLPSPEREQAESYLAEIGLHKSR